MLTLTTLKEHWLRAAAVGLVAGLAAAPIARVYTAQAPMIREINMDVDDLKYIKGTGRPGETFELWWRQRQFEEHHHEHMHWCNYTTDWMRLGRVTVNDKGKWTLATFPLTVQIMPPIADEASCQGSTLNYFELRGAGFTTATPTLYRYHMTDFGWENWPAWVEADVEGAYKLGLAVADGPDDGDTAFDLDTDEDFVDVCAAFDNCGRRVSYRCSGGDLPCPSVTVLDPSPLVGKRDKEFAFVLSMMQAHRPGGSIVAASKVQRQQVGPVVNASVRLKVDLGCGIANHFDFY